MKNDWILDVLSDLRSFAQLNGMQALADSLAETAELAMTEIEMTSVEEKVRRHHGDEFSVGRHTTTPRESRRA